MLKDLADHKPNEREGMRELQRMSHMICSLILSDYPEVDILIQRQKMRERCEELFPDRMDLYEMIYESRFDRLMEQFHGRGDGVPWEPEEE